METDNLNSLKEDMIAFIEGHGMKRFRGYVSEEVASVAWEPSDNPDSWKDFVEIAKGTGATFLTMNEFVLERDDLDYLLERLRESHYVSSEDLEEARWLRSYVGRTGFLQLGWAYQGVMFLYEISNPWYDRYQRLLDVAEECGGITIDESDQDDER